MKTKEPTRLQLAFGCNLKALAIYRITVALVLLAELSLRYRFLHAFYSDEGTLPLTLLRPKIDTLYKFVSIHTLSDCMPFQIVLLTIQIIIAIALLVGYKSNVAAFLSWWMYFSLTLRNTWLAFILDRYFHYLLFYAIWLPIGHFWSIECLPLGKTMPKNTTVMNIATFALKLQIFWIYIDAGVGKLLDEKAGWSYFADPLPALDTYTRHTLVAQYMYGMLGPPGLRLLTPIVVWVEILAAPLCLVGSFMRIEKLQKIAVFAICSLHIGIAFTIRNTALLSFIAMTAWCVYLPPGTFNEKEMFIEQKNITQGKLKALRQLICVGAFIAGSIWFELFSDDCSQSVDHIWSNLLHNRWNVFVGAEEYVTWEIAPGKLVDGSVVDVWSKGESISWDMPVTGAPSTSSSRGGRWRSFPYLAELDGEDGEALWGYLCQEWNAEHDNSEKKLVRYNFFMLQADVLPNMQFSATRKRLIKSYECSNKTFSEEIENDQEKDL